MVKSVNSQSNELLCLAVLQTVAHFPGGLQYFVKPIDFQGNEPLVGERPFTRIGKHSQFGSPTSDGTVSDSAQKPTVSGNCTMVKRKIGKKGRKRISGNFPEIRPLNSTSEFWSNCRLYGPVSRASSPRVGASSTLRLSS